MNCGDFALNLADPAQSGVYQVAPSDLSTLGALARGAGLRVLPVDLAGCGDKRTLLLRLAIQLDFPTSFGRNWDALADALSDLSWLPSAGGYALLLNGLDRLAHRAPADYASLLDVLHTTAISWGERKYSFAAFIAPSDSCG